jgi:hypothetical protein
LSFVALVFDFVSLKSSLRINFQLLSLILFEEAYHLTLQFEWWH